MGNKKQIKKRIPVIKNKSIFIKFLSIKLLRYTTVVLFDLVNTRKNIFNFF